MLSSLLIHVPGFVSMNGEKKTEFTDNAHGLCLTLIKRS